MIMVPRKRRRSSSPLFRVVRGWIGISILPAATSTAASSSVENQEVRGARHEYWSAGGRHVVLVRPHGFFFFRTSSTYRTIDAWNIQTNSSLHHNNKQYTVRCAPLKSPKSFAAIHTRWIGSRVCVRLFWWSRYYGRTDLGVIAVARSCVFGEQDCGRPDSSQWPRCFAVY